MQMVLSHNRGNPEYFSGETHHCLTQMLHGIFTYIYPKNVPKTYGIFTYIWNIYPKNVPVL